MLVIVFVNAKDKSIEILGKALMSLLDHKYFVFTRMPSKYPLCPIEKTMSKLKEICQHSEGDRVIVSFGCRVLPNNIKEIEALSSKTTGNVVFLKRLRGSKTWRLADDGSLLFDNERIADCGIFLISKKDILTSTHTNFNSFTRGMLTKKELKPVFVDFWIFNNSEQTNNRRK